MASSCFARKSKVTLSSKREKDRLGAEFPVAVFTLLFFAVFPMINLIGIVLGACTAGLLTLQLAQTASIQPTYTQALSAMTQLASKLSGSDLAKFIKLQPNGGYTGCGADLYIVATNINGGTSTTYGPNSPLPQNVDSTKQIYEFAARTNYVVGPFIAMNGIPGIAQIPGIGKPMALTWCTSRAAENVVGVQSANLASANATGGSSAGTPPLGVTTSSNLSQTNGSAAVPGQGWRTPNIYQQIANAGQVIVSQDVVIVPGNSNTFTYSGVNVDPSENVWIDTNAVGQWKNGGLTQLDANGTIDGLTIWSDEYCMSLIGYMGGSPPPVNVSTAGSYYENLSGNQVESLKFNHGYTATGVTYPGQFFAVGDTLTNYPISAPGPLSFIANNQNNLSPGTGEQMVRIIVTKKAGQ